MKNICSSHLTWNNRDPSQVQGLCVAAERCCVPVQVVLHASVWWQGFGGVAQGHRQPAGVFQAPATLLPPVHNRRVPTPVVWGVTLEDDAEKKPAKRHAGNAEQREDALLIAAKRASIFQNIIKGHHHGAFHQTFWVLSQQLQSGSMWS